MLAYKYMGFNELDTTHTNERGNKTECNIRIRLVLKTDLNASPPK